MKPEKRLESTVKFLVGLGYDASDATEAAKESIAQGEPLLETLCFHTLAEHVLARIHTSEWITSRAREPMGEPTAVIKRLLDSGASAADLAIFARVMQREYLCNLGCILDGSGIYGTPNLPFTDFRICAIDESGKPQAPITELHEALEFSDLESEMKQSRQSGKT